MERGVRGRDYLIEFLREEAPCDLCEYRLVCKSQDTTCQAFRDYVVDVDPKDRKLSWAWPRMPDRFWKNSFWGK